MRPALRHVTLLLCIGSIIFLAGCGGGGRQPNVMLRPPKPPPAVPARRAVQIDLQLQAAAKMVVVDALKSNDPLVRTHAIEAAKEGMGAEAKDMIMKALGDDAAIVRFAASLAAGELRLRDAHDTLLTLSDDMDPSVRIGAKFALHRLGDLRQSHDMEVTSRDFDPRSRGDTALVLGLLGEPSAVRILKPMLQDRSAPVRLQAAEALWRLGDQDGLVALVGATISAHPDDRMIALIGLAGPRNHNVISHLRGALTSDYDQVSLVAARAMGMLGSDEGYGVALKAAKSTDPQQRQLAALAFGAIGRPDAQDLLAGLLKDAEPDVQLAAAQGVLQLKS